MNVTVKKYTLSEKEKEELNKEFDEIFDQFNDLYPKFSSSYGLENKLLKTLFRTSFALNNTLFDEVENTLSPDTNFFKTLNKKIEKLFAIVDNKKELKEESTPIKEEDKKQPQPKEIDKVQELINKYLLPLDTIKYDSLETTLSNLKADFKKEIVPFTEQKAFTTKISEYYTKFNNRYYESLQTITDKETECRKYEELKKLQEELNISVPKEVLDAIDKINKEEAQENRRLRNIQKLLNYLIELKAIL